MQNEPSEFVEPSMAATPMDTVDSMRSTPSAEPRRAKPGILRLDISKPRRSSGGSVDFRCVSGAGAGGGGGIGGGIGSGGPGSSSSNVTGANSEVSELDLPYAGE
ncbi:GH16305 [Drosophila grimshawi]|uniref:GH16305 n=1 Tax=Drosophila grimshawi TaxID=7222 RepID=B4IY87_DROGR|nr:GH16305 [Drosophila grimshawi]